MKHLLIIVLLALGGCSADNETINNTTHEQTDANAVTLFPSQEMHVTFADISNFYSETMSCMGMTAQGPNVYYKSFELYFNGAVGKSWAFFTGGTIYVNTDTIGPSFPRDRQTDEEALRHEFVHHILWANGADWHHGDPMFAKCGLGVNTYN